MSSVWFLATVVALGVPVGRRVRQHHHRTRRDRARRSQVPEALERMAAGIRSGASLPRALAEAGRTTDPPLGPELADLARATDAGEPLLRVLQRWAARHDDTSTRLAATALALATQIGAAPARAIDGVAATLRERRSLAAERHTQATQARTSAVVLSLAPLVFTGLLVTTNQHAARFLFATPLGWLCLAVGLGLDAGGAVWMSRLTRAEDR